MTPAKRAREVKRAVNSATYLLLEERRLLAQEAISVAKRISRASLSNGQMDNVLKLHGVWCRLGEVEGALQVLTGTPPEQAGVWPSGVRDRDRVDETPAPKSPRRKKLRDAPSSPAR